MKKIILASLVIAATLTPMVYAATADYTEPDVSVQRQQSKASETIQCSGQCETCPDQNCPRRRRPYNNEN